MNEAFSFICSPTKVHSISPLMDLQHSLSRDIQFVVIFETYSDVVAENIHSTNFSTSPSIARYGLIPKLNHSVELFTYTLLTSNVLPLMKPSFNSPFYSGAPSFSLF